MKILFDNGTPRLIAGVLPQAQITLARQIGWHELRNGDLIRKAEDAGYDVLITTDKNIRYQQNLAGRKIALIVLGNSQWPVVRLYLERIVEAVDACTPGSFTEIQIPYKDKPPWI